MCPCHPISGFLGSWWTINAGSVQRSGLDGKSSISWISQVHTQHFLSEWPINVYPPVVKQGVLENSLMNSMILRKKLPFFRGFPWISDIFQDFPRYKPPSFSGMSHMSHMFLWFSQLKPPTSSLTGVSKPSWRNKTYVRPYRPASNRWPASGGMRICQDLP